MRQKLESMSKTLAEQEELKARHEARIKELEKDLQREQTQRQWMERSKGRLETKVEEMQQKLSDALAEERRKVKQFTELKAQHGREIGELAERLRREEMVRQRIERNHRRDVAQVEELQQKLTAEKWRETNQFRELKAQYERTINKLLERLKMEQTVREVMQQNQLAMETELNERKAQMDQMQLHLAEEKTRLSRRAKNQFRFLLQKKETASYTQALRQSIQLVKKVKQLEERLENTSKTLAKERGLKTKYEAKRKELEKELKKEQSDREEMERIKQKIETELGKTKAEVEEMKRKLQEQMNALSEEKAKHETRNKELGEFFKQEQSVAEMWQKLDKMSKTLAEKEELRAKHEDRSKELWMNLQRELIIRQGVERSKQQIETKVKKTSAVQTWVSLFFELNISSIFMIRFDFTIEAQRWTYGIEKTICPMQVENATRGDLHALLDKLDEKDLLLIHVYPHGNVKTRGMEKTQGRLVEKIILDAELDEDWTQKLSGTLAEQRKMAKEFTKQKTEHETRIKELEELLTREQTVLEEMEQKQRMIEIELNERKSQVEEMQQQLLQQKTQLIEGAIKQSPFLLWKENTVSSTQDGKLSAQLTQSMPRCPMQVENATRADLHALLDKLDEKDLVLIHVYPHGNVKTRGMEKTQGRLVEKIILDAELDEDWTVHFFGIERKGYYWIMAMPQKCPPLIIAAQNGYGIIVRLLLELEHDLEEEATVKSQWETIEGASALWCAAAAGHLEVVKTLLEHDLEEEATVKSQWETIEGASALWCAAAAGHLEVVKTLVKAGADVNHSTKTNSTPLRGACFNGKMDIVEYLVEQKANVNLPNKFNSTCLMTSSFRGHLKIAQYLLEHGADPNFKDNNERTALHYAAQSGNVEIVYELITHGAKMINDKYGMTPLLLAAEHSQEAVVRYLMQRFKFNIERHIEALELLGTSFAKQTNNYHPSLCSAYYYLRKAMEERLSGARNPLEKPIIEPIAAYGFHRETRTLEELEEIQFDADTLHMEILIIRERILGSNDPQLVYPIQHRGSVCADMAQYERCIALWTHALELKQRICSSVMDDLLKILQFFSLMLSEEVKLDPSHVLWVLSACVKELERNHQQLRSLSLNPEYVNKAAKELDSNMHTVLNLLVIANKLELRKTDVRTSLFLRQIINRLNRIPLRTSKGQSLLHLACSDSTNIDDINVNR
ncbi:unnamed protein product, partial [Darwinula stevensoni]